MKRGTRAAASRDEPLCSPDNALSWTWKGAHAARGGRGLNVVSEALTCRGQFPLVHDVVAVKDASGLVTSEQHGHTLRHAGPDEVSRCRPATVVKQPSGNASVSARGGPRRLPLPHRYAVALEDEPIGLPPTLGPPIEDLPKRRRDRQQPSDLGL